MGSVNVLKILLFFSMPCISKIWYLGFGFLFFNKKHNISVTHIWNHSWVLEANY